jgi:hypothetical protein
MLLLRSSLAVLAILWLIPLIILTLAFVCLKEAEKALLWMIAGLGDIRP